MKNKAQVSIRYQTEGHVMDRGLVSPEALALILPSPPHAAARLGAIRGHTRDSVSSFDAPQAGA